MFIVSLPRIGITDDDDDEQRTSDPNIKLTEALCTSLRRRQIVGSRNVALATAALVQALVRTAKFNTIDELLLLLKAVGKRIQEANPKELASGNIIRRILRLIREEYRAAALAAQASAPPSTPGTPYLGPETPGLHAPSNHYLSNDLSFSSPSQANSGGSNVPMARQPSLSNFVAMRHSRAQLERAGSVLELSASTTSLFTSPSPYQVPTRQSSLDELVSLASSATPRPGMTSGTSSGVGSRTDVRKASLGSPNFGQLGLGGTEGDDFMKQSAKLKPVLIQAIEEVVGELETTHEDVAKGAREHIHSSEVILTLGHSKTVEAFLRNAYRDRKFTVIVAESAPSYLGHSMATALSSANIPVLLVPDSSLYALMPRVTKVLLGAHSVLANGGLFALSGSLTVALAAKQHSKPVVVTSGQFKFAPVWNLYHEYSAIDFKSPGDVMGYKGNGGGGGVESVEALDPYYDYIRPELVNLFVTNEGDHPPSYIYRLIKEAYDDEDVEL